MHAVTASWWRRFAGADPLAVGALMVMLSMTLAARANRTTSLVVASLYIPYSVFNAAGVSWDWAFFYGLSIGLEVLLLASILRFAWTWPRTAPSATTPTGPDREAARASLQQSSSDL